MNHLALLIQGGQYILFVNGHYMGGFHDAAYEGADFGLYAEGGDASFSNFAVYPLN